MNRFHLIILGVAFLALAGCEDTSSDNKAAAPQQVTQPVQRAQATLATACSDYMTIVENLHDEMHRQKFINESNSVLDLDVAPYNTMFQQMVTKSAKLIAFTENAEHLKAEGIDTQHAAELAKAVTLLTDSAETFLTQSRKDFTGQRATARELHDAFLANLNNVIDICNKDEKLTYRK